MKLIFLELVSVPKLVPVSGVMLVAGESVVGESEVGVKSSPLLLATQCAGNNNNY